MANICFNYIQAFAHSEALDKLRDYLIHEKDIDIVDIGDPIDGELTFTVESRWSPPAEWVCELTEKFSGVLIECEYEEPGSDIWGKFGFRDGVLLFTMELPYLEGKHKAMVWNEFLECEVVGRLEGYENLEDFLADFTFCYDHEVEYLTDLYLNKI